MCGVTVNQVFPQRPWHPLLMQALSGIPDVQAGDSVGGTADMIHGVDPGHDQKGWGNVMYIPAAPWCPAQREVRRQRPARPSSGSSPSDFPRGALRAHLANRFQPEDLNETGAAASALREPRPLAKRPRHDPRPVRPASIVQACRCRVERDHQVGASQPFLGFDRPSHPP
jgi:hypothetical protein